jgi:hypothetical protein
MEDYFERRTDVASGPVTREHNLEYLWTGLNDGCDSKHCIEERENSSSIDFKTGN